MNSKIRQILQDNGLRDNTHAPTASYATQVYQVLRDTLFPHLAKLQQIEETGMLSRDVVVLTRLRSVFKRLGVDLVMSDLREPDPSRLRSHLGKIALYAEFREQLINNPESPANQCRRACAELNDAIAREQRAQRELDNLKSELAEQSQEYPDLEKKRNEARSSLQMKHAESVALGKRATEQNEAISKSQRELERVKAKVSEEKESVEAFRPFVDQKTGVVESTKGRVEALRVEVKQERARQKAQLEANRQLERMCESLKGAEAQLPGLEDVLKDYRVQTDLLQSAQREKAELSTEYERKRRLLSSLEDAVSSLEAQAQQLRDQEAKLQLDIDNAGGEYERAATAMKEEESRITDEITALRVSTGEIKRLLDKQREYNKQVLELLDTAPAKLASAERELDKALQHMSNIRLPPPKN